MGSLEVHASWETTTWGELVELKYGKSLKGYRESGGRYPVYGTNGPVGWTEKPLCEFPSVIVGRKGAYRGVHFSESPFFVIDTAFYVDPKPGVNINLKWAYYALLLADINSMDSGSAIPSTSREDFYALAAYLPPRDVQDRIVNQLDALNNKIELNRQINATLESMAQALFKSWFVDFDPVIDNALAAGNPIPDALQARAKKRAALHARASDESARSATATEGANQTRKAQHQQPNGTDNTSPLRPLPADIRALFPDSFVFTEEMGWVPEGWNQLTVEEIIDRIKVKKRYKKGDVSFSGRVPVFEQGADTLLGFHNEEAEVSATPICPGFIFGDHTCVTRLSITPFSVSENVIALKAAKLDGYWTYYAFKDKQTFEEYRRHWMELIVKPVLVPSDKAATAFGGYVKSMHERMDACFRENVTLSCLRDALLPKLLSGQIQLPEAEKLAAEAL